MKKITLILFFSLSTLLFSQTETNYALFYNPDAINGDNLLGITHYTELKNIIEKNLNYKQICPMVLTQASMYSGEYQYPVTLTILDLEYYKSFPKFEDITKGKFPQNKREILISETIAQKYGLAVGDVIAVSFMTKMLSLWALKLKITGIIPVERDYIYLDYEVNKESIKNLDIVDSVIITTHGKINTDSLQKIINEYRVLSNIQLECNTDPFSILDKK